MKKGLKFIFDIITNSKKDNIGAYSAQSAFFMTISFIPFIMLLISILRFLPYSQDEMLLIIISVFPRAAKTLVSSFIEEAFKNSDIAMISISAVSTLWAASIGVFAVSTGLNKVFCKNEMRNYFSVRFLSMLYTLVLLLLLTVCLLFFVFGNTITELIRQHSPGGIALIFMRAGDLISVAVLSLFFFVMYLTIPHRKAKPVTQIPGALLSGLGWAGFSTLFSYYYENIASYSYIYGSLSVMVFFMLWLFICIYILFIGAEVNKYLEDKLERSALLG